MKARTLLPIQVCLPVSGGLTTCSRSPPRVPSPIHSTQQCSCYPAILCICLVLSLQVLTEFSVRAGKLGLIRDSKEPEFFWGRKHSPSLYAWQGHGAQKPERSALIQVPGFSSSLIISYCHGDLKKKLPVAHVPSIRDTISFAFSPILQIILSCIQPPSHPPNKIFSALVFKSNIFMVDGLPTVRFPQLSLKNCQSLSSSNDRWLGTVKSSEFFP